MPLCGYARLVELLGLPVPPPRFQVESSHAVNRRVLRGDRLLVPVRAAPEGSSLLDHILFALKNEGVNLAVLSGALPHVESDDLQQRIDAAPMSTALRKAAFLWEYFTHGSLRLKRPPKTFIPLFDPERYITGRSMRNEKWRINVNGIGSLAYCPTVGKTELINQDLATDLLKRTNLWFASIGAIAADRALDWAYLNETRGTYELEREPLSEDRSRRFVQLLQHADDEQILSENYLCELQNQVVSSIFNHAYSWRTEQNWLSKQSGRNALSVTHVPPSPDDLGSLMHDYLAMVNSWEDDLDPLVGAAVAAFGFVYLRPFMDGNGRLSRFLIHRQLARSGRLAHGLLLPISIAMKASEEEYLAALTAFSAQARRLWDVTYCGGEPPYDFHFKGTSNLYRYWDATRQVEFTFRMAERALTVHLREEIEYLRLFDEVCRRVEAHFDLRQNHLFTLVTAALERNGRLSKSIRRRFADKVEGAALDFVESVTREVLEEAAEEAGEAAAAP